MTGDNRVLQEEIPHPRVEMLSAKRNVGCLVLFQVLLLQVAFSSAMVTLEESLKRDIVIINVDVFNSEGMTMGDCQRELEKYPGVRVWKQWEIGDRFKGFLIEDP